jgi:glucose/arabinose dehydrogenase
MMLLAALLLALPQDAPSESDYYAVDYLTPPEGEILEIGGMDFLSNGDLVISTRRGRVWIVENALAEDPADATFRLYAEGLQEGLGLKIINDEIYVVQRAELSRLRDMDGDGVCDAIDTITNDWGVSGNYHEFAFGLPVDDEGNFYVSLNVSFFSPKWWHGKSPVPYRGWVIKISPDGEITPFAHGFRSPCGIELNSAGDLFVTDNQGDWMPVGPIYHVQPGKFYGHPASLDWTPEYIEAQTLASDTVPPSVERADAAVWLPYDWSRSAGNLISDDTGGKFGPFADQMFVAELTNGHIVRTQLEKVRGEYQGACFLFRQRIGSAARVRFAPDGTLFAGFTNRGWGGLSPSHGVSRMRWTGKTPMEMERVHLLQDGFEVTFTLPAAEDAAPEIALKQYDYDWWWEYGSPERATTEIPITETSWSADRKTLTLRTAGLTPAMMARCKITGLSAADGAPLLHEEFAYTINQLPEGALTTDHLVKLVPPPPARESGEDGWLRLTYGDAFDAWKSEGWELCNAELDPDDASRLLITEGVNALVNSGETVTDFVSEPVFGDIELNLQFMLTEGASSGVFLMGNYELQLARLACAGVSGGDGWEGVLPADDRYKGPGEWHDLSLVFTAPRFDANGVKTTNAAFLNVMVDEQMVHEKIDLPGVSRGALGPEVSSGPILLRGDGGTVAFGAIGAKPFNLAPDADGWVPLFNGDDVDDWRASGDAEWEVDDETIIGGGEPGLLYSPRGDYTDFDLRARVKISEGGNSGIFLRAKDGASGFEAEINSSYPDPEKTGSVRGMAPVLVHLVGPDTWFDYGISVRDTDAGTQVSLRVNGVLVNEYVDTTKRFQAGHIALEQHHPGSVVEVREIAIREH